MEFASLISAVLKRTKLNSEKISELTSPVSLALFSQAFVPKEVDPRSNYERLEFEGDVVVNMVVVEYIGLRFPEILDVGHATRIKHNLISKKQLGLMAMKLGFDRFVRYGEKIRTSLARDPKREENAEWMSLMEDVFEAFIGALVKLSNERWSRGVGYHLAFNLVTSILDDIGVDTAYDKVYDPKSRLKEIYDQEHWTFDRRVFVVNETIEGETRTYTVSVYKPGERRPYVVTSGVQKTNTEHDAAEKAISALAASGIVNRKRGGKS